MKKVARFLLHLFEVVLLGGLLLRKPLHSK